ncbi:MAG: hypothetical protein WDZ80_03785 [Candidatus Paceibacterota bacterium]
MNKIEKEDKNMKSKNITDDVLIINYIAIKKENDKTTKSLRISIWKKFNNNYQMISHQGTDIN